MFDHNNYLDIKNYTALLQTNESETRLSVPLKNDRSDKAAPVVFTIYVNR